MAKQFKTRLRQELEEQTDSQAGDLADIAAPIAKDGQLRRPMRYKRRMADSLLEAGGRPKVWVPRLAMSLVAVLLLVSGIVTASQNSMPDSRLYPVKRWSEQVRVTFDSDYTQQIVERRIREIQYLAAQDKHYQTVKSMLDRFSSRLREYDRDTSMFTESLRTLKKIEKDSSPKIQPVIHSTIESFDDRPESSPSRTKQGADTKKPEKTGQTPDLPDPAKPKLH